MSRRGNILAERIGRGQGGYFTSGMGQPQGIVAGSTPGVTAAVPRRSRRTKNGTKTILFDALGKYKIRDVNSLRLKRLVERYAEIDQLGFVAFMRSAGRLLHAGGNPIKHLLQA